MAFYHGFYFFEANVNVDLSDLSKEEFVMKKYVALMVVGILIFILGAIGLVITEHPYISYFILLSSVAIIPAGLIGIVLNWYSK